jgi:hypothetical protein
VKGDDRPPGRRDGVSHSQSQNERQYRGEHDPARRRRDDDGRPVEREAMGDRDVSRFQCADRAQRQADEDNGERRQDGWRRPLTRNGVGTAAAQRISR